MAIKLSYESKESIPEGLVDLYVEKDGKYALEVEGAVDKRKLDEFRANNIEYRKQIEALEGKFSGIDVDEYQALKEEKEALKDKQLMDEGKIEELLVNRTEKMKQGFEHQVGKLSSDYEKIKLENDSLKGQLADTMTSNMIAEAANDVGTVRPGAMKHIQSLARDVWKFNEGQLRAVDKDGLPIYGKDGTSNLQPKEWLQGVASTDPYLFEATSGSGANGSEPPRRFNGKSVSVADLTAGVTSADIISKLANGEVSVRE